MEFIDSASLVTFTPIVFTVYPPPAYQLDSGVAKTLGELCNYILDHPPKEVMWKQKTPLFVVDKAIVPVDTEMEDLKGRIISFFDYETSHQAGNFTFYETAQFQALVAHSPVIFRKAQRQTEFQKPTHIYSNFHVVVEPDHELTLKKNISLTIFSTHNVSIFGKIHTQSDSGHFNEKMSATRFDVHAKHLALLGEITITHVNLHGCDLFSMSREAKIHAQHCLIHSHFGKIQLSGHISLPKIQAKSEGHVLSLKFIAGDDIELQPDCHISTASLCHVSATTPTNIFFFTDKLHGGKFKRSEVAIAGENSICLLQAGNEIFLDGDLTIGAGQLKLASNVARIGPAGRIQTTNMEVRGPYADDPSALVVAQKLSVEGSLQVFKRISVLASKMVIKKECSLFDVRGNAHIALVESYANHATVTVGPSQYFVIAPQIHFGSFRLTKPAHKRFSFTPRSSDSPICLVLLNGDYIAIDKPVENHSKDFQLSMLVRSAEHLLIDTPLHMHGLRIQNSGKVTIRSSLKLHELTASPLMHRDAEVFADSTPSFWRVNPKETELDQKSASDQHSRKHEPLQFDIDHVNLEVYAITIESSLWKGESCVMMAEDFTSDIESCLSFVELGIETNQHAENRASMEGSQFIKMRHKGLVVQTGTMTGSQLHFEAGFSYVAGSIEFSESAIFTPTHTMNIGYLPSDDPQGVVQQQVRKIEAPKPKRNFPTPAEMPPPPAVPRSLKKKHGSTPLRKKMRTLKSSRALQAAAKEYPSNPKAQVDVFKLTTRELRSAFNSKQMLEQPIEATCIEEPRAKETDHEACRDLSFEMEINASGDETALLLSTPSDDPPQKEPSSADPEDSLPAMRSPSTTSKPWFSWLQRRPKKRKSVAERVKFFNKKPASSSSSSSSYSPSSSETIKEQEVLEDLQIKLDDFVDINGEIEAQHTASRFEGEDNIANQQQPKWMATHIKSPKIVIAGLPMSSYSSSTPGASSLPYDVNISPLASILAKSTTDLATIQVVQARNISLEGSLIAEGSVRVVQEIKEQMELSKKQQEKWKEENGDWWLLRDIFDDDAGEEKKESSPPTPYYPPGAQIQIHCESMRLIGGCEHEDGLIESNWGVSVNAESTLSGTWYSNIFSRGSSLSLSARWLWWRGSAIGEHIILNGWVIHNGWLIEGTKSVSITSQIAFINIGLPVASVYCTGPISIVSTIFCNCGYIRASSFSLKTLVDLRLVGVLQCRLENTSSVTRFVSPAHVWLFCLPEPGEPLATKDIAFQAITSSITSFLPAWAQAMVTAAHTCIALVQRSAAIAQVIKEFITACRTGNWQLINWTDVMTILLDVKDLGIAAYQAGTVVSSAIDATKLAASSSSNNETATPTDPASEPLGEKSLSPDQVGALGVVSHAAQVGLGVATSAVINSLLGSSNTNSLFTVNQGTSLGGSETVTALISVDSGTKILATSYTNQSVLSAKIGGNIITQRLSATAGTVETDGKFMTDTVNLTATTGDVRMDGSIYARGQVNATAASGTIHATASSSTSASEGVTMMAQNVQAEGSVSSSDGAFVVQASEDASVSGHTDTKQLQVRAEADAKVSGEHNAQEGIAISGGKNASLSGTASAGDSISVAADDGDASIVGTMTATGDIAAVGSGKASISGTMKSSTLAVQAGTGNATLEGSSSTSATYVDSQQASASIRGTHKAEEVLSIHGKKDATSDGEIATKNLGVVADDGTARIVGHATVQSALVKGARVADVSELASGRGALDYKNLAIETQEHVVLRHDVTGERNLSVTAASLSQQSQVNLVGSVAYTATKGNVSVDGELRTTQQAFIESKQANAIINRKIVADTVQVEAAGMAQNNSNVVASTSVGISAGSVDQRGVVLAGQDVSISATKRSVINYGVIQGGRFVSVAAVGNVENRASERLYQGQYDWQKEYTPAQIIGGTGIMPENGEGGPIGLVIKSTEGKVINDASVIKAQGSIVISAYKGFESLTRTHTYVCYYKKSRKWHGKKTVEQRTTTQVARSTVASTSGTVVIDSEAGGITSTSGLFHSATGTSLSARDAVVLQDTVTRDTHTKKSSWVFGSSSSRRTDEVSYATVIQDKSGNTVIVSREANIKMIGTSIQGPGGLITKAKTGIEMIERILHHEITTKTSGFSLKFSGIDYLKSGGPIAALKNDPMISAFQDLSSAGTAGAKAITAASTTVPETIRSMQALANVTDFDNMAGFLSDRAGLDALSSPTLSISFGTTRTKQEWETQAGNSIEKGFWIAEAPNVHIEGMNISIAGNVALRANAVCVMGQDLHQSSSMRSSSFGITLGGKSGLSFNASIARSSAKGTHNAQANLSLGGNLSINPLSDPTGSGTNVLIQGATVNASTMTGKIAVLDIRDVLDTCSSKFSSSSLSVPVSGAYAFGSYSQSKSSSAQVAQSSGIHIKDGFSHDGERLQVDHVEQYGGVIESPESIPANSITVTQVKEHSSSSGFSVSGVPIPIGAIADAFKSPNTKDNTKDGLEKTSDEVSSKYPTSKAGPSAMDLITKVKGTIDRSESEATRSSLITGGTGTAKVTGDFVTESSKVVHQDVDTSYKVKIAIPIDSYKQLVPLIERVSQIGGPGEQPGYLEELNPMDLSEDVFMRTLLGQIAYAAEKKDGSLTGETSAERAEQARESTIEQLKNSGNAKNLAVADKLSTLRFVRSNRDMVSYYDEKNNIIYNSYAGTRNMRDLANDVLSAGGLLGLLPIGRVATAKEFRDSVKKDYPNATMIDVGHSLGGGIAEIMAASDGSESTTFNPAPIPAPIALRTGGEVRNAYRVDADIVSATRRIWKNAYSIPVRVGGSKLDPLSAHRLDYFTGSLAWSKAPKPSP